MKPKSETVIKGHVVREYYWAGEHPCFVDKQLVTAGYDEVVRMIERGEIPEVAA